jgi:hypothetical protein
MSNPGTTLMSLRKRLAHRKAGVVLIPAGLAVLSVPETFNNPKLTAIALDQLN